MLDHLIFTFIYPFSRHGHRTLHRRCWQLHLPPHLDLLVLKAGREREDQNHLSLRCKTFSKLGCSQSDPKWQFEDRSAILSDGRGLADIIAIPNCQVLAEFESPVVVILLGLQWGRQGRNCQHQNPHKIRERVKKAPAKAPRSQNLLCGQPSHLRWHLHVHSTLWQCHRNERWPKKSISQPLQMVQAHPKLAWNQGIPDEVKSALHQRSRAEGKLPGEEEEE